MGRTRAAIKHLWPSLLVMMMIAGLILFAWYPYPFLQLKDSDKFAVLLVISACLAGPAMTWVVFKPGKWGLKFDLVIIVLIQITAVSWAGYTLYERRPYFMVFTVDQFEVLSRRDVDIAEITDQKFLNKPFSGPILLYASMPRDKQGSQKLLHEVLFEGKPDLEFRPEFWSLYTEKQKLVLPVSKPLSGLRESRPEHRVAIDKLVRQTGGDVNRLKFVPAKLPNGGFAAILDADSGEVVGKLEIDPWIN